jgi:hypothetical protein
MEQKLLLELQGDTLLARATTRVYSSTGHVLFSNGFWRMVGFRVSA